ncbi:uncharacterized protein MONOS_17355 [Monocercomonoides exilis]|uniref:uncharacterized protein n=1 Tax=Monocercomonoides exilis TaxID=2049356 RepID=UPI00355A74AB|nr:hypothetical protein MONOS_17355 [Monocercomonoides exilis]
MIGFKERMTQKFKKNSKKEMEIYLGILISINGLKIEGRVSEKCSDTLTKVGEIEGLKVLSSKSMEEKQNNIRRWRLKEMNGFNLEKSFIGS